MRVHIHLTPLEQCWVCKKMHDGFMPNLALPDGVDHDYNTLSYTIKRSQN